MEWPPQVSLSQAPARRKTACGGALHGLPLTPEPRQVVADEAGLHGGLWPLLELAALQQQLLVEGEAAGSPEELLRLVRLQVAAAAAGCC